jgi:hypothetical protein
LEALIEDTENQLEALDAELAVVNDILLVE